MDVIRQGEGEESDTVRAWCSSFPTHHSQESDTDLQFGDSRKKKKKTKKQAASGKSNFSNFRNKDYSGKKQDADSDE